MAAIETNVTNRAESTLSAPLALGATTINVTSTSAFPAVPFYCVIDPEYDDKAEVVLVDSGKTATTLTLSAAGQRGQDNTSDVSHDTGAVIAVVPVAALWTDINDRVDVVASSVASHDHDGTGDVQIATSNLTGHTEAAHTALGLFNDTSHDAHDHSAAAASIASADLADHDKATHDALALDHGSLSGTTDDDHVRYGHGSAQVKNTGAQSITAGVETTLVLDETDWIAGCSLASNTLSVTYAGRYRVYASAAGSSSSGASSGTFRLKVGGVTQLSSVVGFGGGTSIEASIGVASSLAGANVQTIDLSAGDDITLTIELTGGSGHSTSTVYLYVERMG